jgi:hypothetical protein
MTRADTILLIRTLSVAESALAICMTKEQDERFKDANAWAMFQDAIAILIMELEVEATK